MGVIESASLAGNNNILTSLKLWDTYYLAFLHPVQTINIGFI
jgi:hypothetical protein